MPGITINDSTLSNTGVAGGGSTVTITITERSAMVDELRQTVAKLQKAVTAAGPSGGHDAAALPSQIAELQEAVKANPAAYGSLSTLASRVRQTIAAIGKNLPQVTDLASKIVGLVGQLHGIVL